MRSRLRDSPSIGLVIPPFSVRIRERSDATYTLPAKPRIANLVEQLAKSNAADCGRRLCEQWSGRNKKRQTDRDERRYADRLLCDRRELIGHQQDSPLDKAHRMAGARRPI